MSRRRKMLWEGLLMLLLAGGAIGLIGFCVCTGRTTLNRTAEVAFQPGWTCRLSLDGTLLRPGFAPEGWVGFFHDGVETDPEAEMLAELDCIQVMLLEKDGTVRLARKIPVKERADFSDAHKEVNLFGIERGAPEIVKGDYIVSAILWRRDGTAAPLQPGLALTVKWTHAD